MIYLIGGSSHVGKTLMAQRLMERRRVPYVCLDHMKMAFIRSGRTKLTPYDDYDMRYFLWPFAAEWIRTAIENQQELILEGCYIPKEWKESFSEEELSQIRSVFIVMSEDYLRAHFDDVEKHACAIEQRKSDELDLERLIICSREFKEDCEENGTPVLEIDSDYEPEDIADRAEDILFGGRDASHNRKTGPEQHPEEERFMVQRRDCSPWV